FYHPSEDSLVKSPEKLFEIYLTSVGRGSTLLLNVPPDRRGVIHEQDVASLRGWRALLDSAFHTNHAQNASVTASSYRGNSPDYDGNKVTDGNENTYWTIDDDQKTGMLEIDMGEAKTVRYVVLQEPIALGQRVKRFSVDAWKGDTWM